MDHLFAVTDRIIVLRQGRLGGDFHTDAANRERIVPTLTEDIGEVRTDIRTLVEDLRQFMPTND